jgi:hypothetical protein
MEMDTCAEEVLRGLGALARRALRGGCAAVAAFFCVWHAHEQHGWATSLGGEDWRVFCGGGDGGGLGPLEGAACTSASWSKHSSSDELPREEASGANMVLSRSGSAALQQQLDKREKAGKQRKVR